jgi:hypothetical protein
MVSTRFIIKWEINEDKWDKARAARQTNLPGSDYDLSLTPLYDLLYGYVQFIYDDTRLFRDQNTPVRGKKLSVLDLAVELVRALGAGQFADAPDGTVVQLVELEFRVEISFARRLSQVIITTNQPGSHELSVPQETFFQGTQEFLTNFVGEIRKREPSLLDWKCVTELRDF